MFNNQLLTYGTLILISLFTANFSYAETELTCFTPASKCAPLIIQALRGANKSIYIQAYQFTSKPIADAVIDAKNRGLSVEVILDKTQLNAKNSQYFYLIENRIPIYIDKKVAIAHNKVMIIDRAKVITGSYNFTKNAEDRNAENLLIINDAALAGKYLNNFNSRKAVSEFMDQNKEKSLADKIEYDCRTNANEFVDYDFCRQVRLSSRHDSVDS
jgi:phosphatidylserine/phosphatidylglycerophosphate/cardiolipin synthase-like enzyme